MCILVAALLRSIRHCLLRVYSACGALCLCGVSRVYISGKDYLLISVSSVGGNGGAGFSVVRGLCDGGRSWFVVAFMCAVSCVVRGDSRPPLLPPVTLTPFTCTPILSHLSLPLPQRYSSNTCQMQWLHQYSAGVFCLRCWLLFVSSKE